MEYLKDYLEAQSINKSKTELQKRLQIWMIENLDQLEKEINDARRTTKKTNEKSN